MTRKLSYPLLICAIILLLGATLTSVSCARGPRPLEALFSAADIDKNGLISENEWHTAMQHRFEKIDVNKDRQISQAEAEEAKAKANAIQNWRQRGNRNL